MPTFSDGAEVRRTSDGSVSDVELLADRGLDPIAVIGASAEGGWREESFAVSGLDRARACELGHRFGQTAIFKLTEDQLRVLRCPDGAVMRTRGRPDAIGVGAAGGR